MRRACWCAAHCSQNHANCRSRASTVDHVQRVDGSPGGGTAPFNLHRRMHIACGCCPRSGACEQPFTVLHAAATLRSKEAGGSISTPPTVVLWGVTFYGGEKALTIHSITVVNVGRDLLRKSFPALSVVPKMPAGSRVTVITDDRWSINPYQPPGPSRRSRPKRKMRESMSGLRADSLEHFIITQTRSGLKMSCQSSS